MDITDIELGRQQWQTLKLGLDALDGTCLLYTSPSPRD